MKLAVNEVMKEVVNKPGGFDTARMGVVGTAGRRSTVEVAI